MIRKFAALSLSLLMITLLTGCWNRMELNDLAIAVGMGIDKNGDNYRISVQVVDPGGMAAKKGGSARAPTTLYSAEADTIFEAIRKMTMISSRKLYFSHLRMLVIGESMAREGVKNILDFIARDHELRADFYIVVAQGTQAEDTLQIMTALDPIPANKMFLSLQTSERNWSPSTTVTLNQLITDITSQGKQPILTGLRIMGDVHAGEALSNVDSIKPAAELVYSGLAVFKGDKLIGWLSEEESRGFNFIEGRVRSSVGDVACPGGGKVVNEILRTQTSMKGRVDKGRPHIDVHLRVEENVGEIACKSLDFSKDSTIKELESVEAKRLQGIMESVVDKAQHTFKSDIFGFGEAIRRGSPQAWKKLKEDWDDEGFRYLSVNIQVKATILGMGKLNNSFLKEIKE